MQNFSTNTFIEIRHKSIYTSWYRRQSLLPVDVQARVRKSFDIHRYVTKKYRDSSRGTSMVAVKGVDQFFNTLEDSVQKYRAVGGNTGDGIQLKCSNQLHIAIFRRRNKQHNRNRCWVLATLLDMPTNEREITHGIQSSNLPHLPGRRELTPETALNFSNPSSLINCSMHLERRRLTRLWNIPET